MLKKSLWISLLALFSVLLSVSSRAELMIEISQGVDNPTKIAVMPLQWKGQGLLPEDVSKIIQTDLKRSGLFSFPKQALSPIPYQQPQVVFGDWRAIGVEYLLIGGIVQQGTGYDIRYELYDVYRQKRLLKASVSAGLTNLRDLAHHISDVVYEKLTGRPGAFSTRIMYVSADRKAPKHERYKLFISDADGARARLVLKSAEPIMAPNWSYDAKHIAYVSFENDRPAIYRQELATGKRELMARFKGLNSSPAWSPDGKTLAMVLSKDGNSEIYLMDVATKQLTRVTRNRAIDTEPAWMPDGKSLLFTSDRHRTPQIFQYHLGSKKIQRVSYHGRYNARARPLPDGRRMVLVHGDGAGFHIAIQDLVSKEVDILSRSNLDESPSVAPNASMVMYATKRQGHGVLAIVSIDSKVKLFLPGRSRDVREPAWSPYLNQ